MTDTTTTDTTAAPEAETPATDAPAAEAAPFDPERRATELAILDALRAVVDPEIGMNVVELALIKQILLGPDSTEIKMILTTPFCPYAGLDDRPGQGAGRVRRRARRQGHVAGGALGPARRRPDVVSPIPRAIHEEHSTHERPARLQPVRHARPERRPDRRRRPSPRRQARCAARPGLPDPGLRLDVRRACSSAPASRTSSSRTRGCSTSRPTTSSCCSSASSRSSSRSAGASTASAPRSRWGCSSSTPRRSA